MITTTTKLGKHENVTVITFGHGSVSMTRARNKDAEFCHMLFINEQDGKKIGEISTHLDGKTSDELEKPIVLEFLNPQSLTALIHSLVELQKDVFEGQHEIKINNGDPAIFGNTD